MKAPSSSGHISFKTRVKVGCRNFWLPIKVMLVTKSFSKLEAAIVTEGNLGPFFCSLVLIFEFIIEGSYMHKLTQLLPCVVGSYSLSVPGC